MRHVLTLAAVAATFAVASVAGAQQAVPRSEQSITLDDAVRLALTRNTTLEVAENAQALGAAAVRQQKLQFLPDLRVTTSTGQNYGRTFSETEGRIVDQTTQSMSAGLSSSVTLFNGFGNVASLRSAQLDEEATAGDAQRARQTVVFTVASNFLALIQRQEELAVQRVNLAAQEAQEKQVQAFVNAGSRPISDLYQQQATVASAKASVVAAQRAVELAKVDLMQTLQLDPRGSYAFETPELAATTSTPAPRFDLDSLLARALAQRSDLDAEELRVSAAGQDVRAAKSSLWPTISLSAGYNSQFSSATDVAFMDQLNQRRGGSIGVGISIPLFDRGTTSLATQRAQIAEDNARLALRDQQQQVGLEVRRAYLDHESARQQLAAADAQQRAADLALEAAQQRYQAGAATLLEVTQARAAQLQAASAAVTARYEQLFQRKVMEYYVGDLDAQGLTLE